MSREQDALFAEKVPTEGQIGLGSKVVYRTSSQRQVKDGEYGWEPAYGGWYLTYGTERDGNLLVEPVPEYSTDYSLVTEMMEGIDTLLGGESIVVLRLENGRYCAMADWVTDTRHHAHKNYGDGTPNGALLALGLAVAGEVQKMHKEE